MPLVCLYRIAWMVCQSSCTLMSYLVAGVKNIHVLHVSSVHTYIENTTLKLHLRVFAVCDMFTYSGENPFPHACCCTLCWKTMLGIFTGTRQGTRCEEQALLTYIHVHTQLICSCISWLHHNSTSIQRVPHPMALVFLLAQKTCGMKIGGASNSNISLKLTELHGLSWNICMNVTTSLVMQVRILHHMEVTKSTLKRHLNLT